MSLFFKTLIKGVALNGDELSPLANWIVSNQILQMIFISILLSFLIILILRNYMKQEKVSISLFIVIILISGFCFYWFSTRPTKIRVNCAYEVSSWTKENNITTDQAKAVDVRLNLCLYKNGLNR